MKKNEAKSFKRATLSKVEWVDFFLLIFILTLAIIFRLYKINTPLADLHSWRQADTAAVARNFVKQGFNLLYPRYDDLTSIESGKENPQGYRFVEFPIYNSIFAYTYKLFPFFPIEVHGRIVSVFFSLIIIAIIYYLSLLETDRITAVAASFIYAVFPFFVFFSRTVLPETTALSFAFISIFFLYLWFKHQTTYLLITSYYLLSMIFFSLSLLVKPTVVFYTVAMILLFWRKYKWALLTKINFYLFFILAAIPFLAWRYHISFYPEGVPASNWLISYVNTFEGPKNIFFKPAFFRWIFFERINVAMFGGYLTFLFLLGVLSKTKKYFLHGLLLSAAIYLFTFQGGNVQHEYYQTLLLPPMAIFIGLGTNALLKGKNYSSLFISIPIIVGIFCLSFYFSFYKVRDFYNVPNDLIQMAKIISTFTSEKDKIVTDRMGDTTLLYLANRRGAPAIYKDPQELKNIGYQYLITSTRETIEQYKKNKNYRLIFDNNQFALFEL